MPIESSFGYHCSVRQLVHCGSREAVGEKEFYGGVQYSFPYRVILALGHI